MSLSSDFLLYVGIIFFTRYTYISASILPLISKESKALRMVSSSSAPEKETDEVLTYEFKFHKCHHKTWLVLNN